MRKLPTSGFTTFSLHERGFTMVELLVVITIIAILATIGIFGFTMAVRVTRDAKRQADLKIIQSALEQYHSDEHNYPPGQISFTVGSNFTAPYPDDTKVYLNNVPTEPLTLHPNYLFIPRTRAGGDCSSNPANCQSYCLYARLEVGSVNTACTNTGSYNLEVTPP